MDEALAVALPSNHPLTGRPSVSFSDLDGGEFLLQRGVGFWYGLVVHRLPHARLVVLDNRNAYLRLADATDTAIFVTAESDPSTAGERRTVVPISDDSAHASFYLFARREEAGPAKVLFDALRKEADGETRGQRL